MDLTIKKHMRSSTDEGLNDYIEQLENYFLTLRASNTNTLIFKLDELNGAISEDVQKILDGESVEYIMVGVKDPVTGGIVQTEVCRSTLKVLNDDKDSKVFDRCMTLYGKIKDMKAVADYVSAMIPPIEKQEVVVSKEGLTEITTTPQLKMDGVNVFEFAQKQATGKKSGSAKP